MYHGQNQLNTCNKFAERWSEEPKTYSRPDVPSISTHFKVDIGILSALYPRFNLQTGALWPLHSSFLKARSVFEFKGHGTLQMNISPLLYPTTTLLPIGQAQHAAVTFFVSWDRDCNVVPPAVKMALLSWIAHNVITPSE